MNTKSKCFYFLPVLFFCIACNINSDQKRAVGEAIARC